MNTHTVTLHEVLDNPGLRRRLFDRARRQRREAIRAGLAWLAVHVPGFGPSIVGRHLARLG